MVHASEVVMSIEVVMMMMMMLGILIVVIHSISNLTVRSDKGIMIMIVV